MEMAVEGCCCIPPKALKIMMNSIMGLFGLMFLVLLVDVTPMAAQLILFHVKTSSVTTLALWGAGAIGAFFGIKMLAKMICKE